jgi:hypothetical protein
MRRRRFLAAAGLATVPLAGCPSRSEPADGTATPTASPTTTSPAPELSVAAELDSLQPAVVTLYVDSIDVDAEPGRQYLFLEVTVDAGDPPRREDLRVRFDGDRHDPASVDRLWRAYSEDDGRYDSERGEGWILFDLPASGDASGVALGDASTGAEWPITGQASTNFDGRLASPTPPLSVELAGPAQVGLGTQPTVTLTVTNEGDRDGTFVGGLNRVGPAVPYAPVEAIRRVVPPGEPTTVEVTDEMRLEHPSDDELGDGTPDVTYRLQWTGERRSQDVRLVEADGGN